MHEFLVALGPARAARHPISARVTYHDACHLAHGQRIRSQPRALLRSIPGLQLVEVADGEQCCGSAGTYNLFQPESADEVGERKVAAVLRTRPELLASANPGCTLHIQRLLKAKGMSLRAAHPVEILDASIRGVGLPIGEPDHGQVPAARRPRARRPARAERPPGPALGAECKACRSLGALRACATGQGPGSSPRATPRTGRCGDCGSAPGSAASGELAAALPFRSPSPGSSRADDTVRVHRRLLLAATMLERHRTAACPRVHPGAGGIGRPELDRLEKALAQSPGDPVLLFEQAIGHAMLCDRDRTSGASPPSPAAWGGLIPETSGASPSCAAIPSSMRWSGTSGHATPRCSPASRATSSPARALPRGHGLRRPHRTGLRGKRGNKRVVWTDRSGALHDLVPRAPGDSASPPG